MDTRQLDPELLDRVGILTLDVIGSIIRARQDSESTPALIAAAEALGLAKGSCHVLSDRRTWTPAGAALINGVLGHSLDFDDTHAEAILHPAAAIVPAALAAAEMQQSNGAEIAAAIVAGYEVALRIALALPAAAHYQRGFHPSATCGAFGAAAAASRIFHLDPTTMLSAFGIALSQSAGSLQFLANGAWTKRFQVGWSSMAGLTAACLAREGFIGASDPLAGKHGFLRSYSDAPDPLRAIQGLGRVFELMRTGIKPYPSCRWGHAGIDTALEIRRDEAFQLWDVQSVELGISRSAMLLIGEPADRKAAPKNIVEAQFSGPFVIATALATGRMDWNSYAALGDVDLVRLMARVHCVLDPEIDAEAPKNMSGKLSVRLSNNSLTRKVIVPKGDPENFLSKDEVRTKFDSLTDGVFDRARRDTLANKILGLGDLASVSELFEA